MESALTAPLVTHHGRKSVVDTHREGAVTKYARAGLLSRATFSWMNPLLQHRAPWLHDHFTQNSRPGSLLLCTLWRSFWRPFLACGLLALVRVSVLFVGPLLIRRLTENWERNYALVAILAVSKLVEVVTSHQYNFQCQKLGMQVRSALITCIFRKGLRLSSTSRQSHGVGQIVNYMSVDVQQLSDVMLQVHTLWVVPVQMAVAVAILASVMRLAALAGLLVMAMAGAITLLIAWRQNGFQGKIMEGRDRRMKAFNESLHNMKVGDTCISTG
jgi:ATP-binding cassette subfamily C (CFTR/MRP) protein 2